MTHCHTHLRVCGVHVHKEHVKGFLADAGLTLMGLDATVAVMAIHHLEPFAGTAGKTGATMAGMVPLFEGLFKSARSLA